MTASTPDTGTPILTAAELVAGLGSFPTVTFPIRRGRAVDAEALCEYLGEPAEFFGLARPDVSAIRDAIRRFAATTFESSPDSVAAATLTLLGGRLISVTGTTVTPWLADPVRIAAVGGAAVPTTPDTERWVQMAGRTVSHATTDHLLRTLADRNCVDGVPDGPDLTAPLSGALVLELGGTYVGVGARGPLAILDQLQDCGVVADMEHRTTVAPTDVQRAWWISPQFITRPVALLAGRIMPVDPNRPSFLEIP